MVTGTYDGPMQQLQQAVQRPPVIHLHPDNKYPAKTLTNVMTNIAFLSGIVGVPPVSRSWRVYTW